MRRCVPREWLSYNYLDPRKILLSLRAFEHNLTDENRQKLSGSLRSNKYKQIVEGRQAALFCYGMSQIHGIEVQFSQVERQDYDIVSRYLLKGEPHYVPVNLKEWVPVDVNPDAVLQNELDKLRKYGDSKDLVIAFHLNRNVRVEPAELRIPKGIVKEIWFFGAADAYQHRWSLIGNLTSDSARYHEFNYPTE